MKGGGMSEPPYLDFVIDGWKVAVLTILFVILLVGALTWFGAPWAFWG